MIQLSTGHDQQVHYGGREWSSGAWVRYQRALARSESLWADADRDLLERLRNDDLQLRRIDSAP